MISRLPIQSSHWYRNSQTLPFRFLSNQKAKEVTSSQSLSHASPLTEATQPIKESQRRRLKMEPINHKLLHQLDTIKLGYIAQRRIRKKVAEKYRAEELESETTTNVVYCPPFFKRKGKIVQKLNRWDDATATKVMADLYDIPQVAVIGRSNVGKSSLVNCIVGFDNSFVQKANMSDRPGETKDLTFFMLEKRRPKLPKEMLPVQPNISVVENKQGVLLVDMPGYGFAFMSEDDKKRCRDLSYKYLLLSGSNPKSRQLKRVLLLVDARHGIKASDVSFFKELEDMFRNQYASDKIKLSWKLQLVVTKCDLVERKELCKRLSLIEKDISGLLPSRFLSNLPITPVSSYEHKGVDELKQIIAAIIS